MKRITVYEPDNSIKRGYMGIIAEIFSEFRRNRWLTFQLFKRDIITIYKQSFLGLFWIFIMPFVSIGVFVIMKRSNVFSVGEMEVPYPLYAAVGFCIWQIFSTGMISSVNSIVKAGSMVSKINFSKKSLVVAACAQSVVTFLVQFLLVILLFLIYKVRLSAGAIWFPLTLIPIIFFTLGIGLIIGLLNSILRDIGNVVTMALTLLLFLTPILYVKPESGILRGITEHNPLYYMISVPRDILIRGATAELNGFILSSIAAFLIFYFCLVAFHMTESRIAERI